MFVEQVALVALELHQFLQLVYLALHRLVLEGSDHPVLHLVPLDLKIGCHFLERHTLVLVGQVHEAGHSQTGQELLLVDLEQV